MSEIDILMELNELITDLIEKMRTEIAEGETICWCTQERINGLAVLIQARTYLIMYARRG